MTIPSTEASASRWQTGRMLAAQHEFGISIIEIFLRKYLMASEQILAEERKVHRKDPSPSLKGQIQYHANQVSTIRWLISVNAQSRKLDNAKSIGGSKRRKSQRTGTDAAVGDTSDR